MLPRQPAAKRGGGQPSAGATHVSLPAGAQVLPLAIYPSGSKPPLKKNTHFSYGKTQLGASLSKDLFNGRP